MPVFMITQDPLNMTHSKEIMEIGFVKDWQYLHWSRYYISLHMDDADFTSLHHIIFVLTF